MHDGRLLRHHLTLAPDVLELLVLLIGTIQVPERAIQVFFLEGRRGLRLRLPLALTLTPKGTRDTHVSVHEQRIRLGGEVAVVCLQDLRHDALQHGGDGGELAQAEEHPAQHADGLPQTGQEARPVGDAGGAHGEGEAALRVARLLEDPRLEAEQLDLAEDVEIVLVDGSGGRLDELQRERVVALADAEVDRQEGQEEGDVGVWELDRLQLGEEMLGGYFIVTGRLLGDCLVSFHKNDLSGAEIPVDMSLELQHTGEECPVLVRF